MANQTSQPQAPAVTLVPPSFNTPQGSIKLFAPDTTKNLSINLEESTSVTQQLNPMQNSDVIANWQLNQVLAVTAPTGATSSVNTPFSALSNVNLVIQNTFTSLNTNGVDLAIKNIVWPYREAATFPHNATPSNPAYPTNYESQAYGPGSYTDSSTTLASAQFIDLGPGQHFDHYFNVDVSTGWPIAINGVLSQRLVAGVQYLGGTTRNIVANLTYNPILGTKSSNGLYTGTATASGSGSATVTLYREGWFSNTNPAMMPAVTNWIPKYTTTFINIGATNEWTYQIPQSLQVLGLVFRFYDLSADTYPSVSNITSIQQQVGSGVIQYNGNGITAQQRLYQQIGLPANALPAGTTVLDFMHDEKRQTTNANAINTYTTNGAVCNFEFGSVGSSGFGCYVSVYGLQYVDQGSGI